MGLELEGIETLRAELRGRLLLPSEAAFTQATSVWSVSPNHPARLPAPALVVQPRGTADVSAAVKFAAAHGLPLAGNPSWVDGGLMIDLSLMRRWRCVYVDPGAKTAVVDGGALACDVDAETALHGLAAPLGVCCVVGMGLVLNGGISLLSRAHGPACDSILGAQVVLADGSVVNVTSGGPDPDLFWALRGAGSTLGVVTKLTLQLYDAPTYSGAFVWRDDPEHATFKSVLRWIRAVVLPDPAVGFNCARMVHPELGPVLISMLVIVGDRPVEEKEALVQPLRELGPIQASDSVGRSSWHQTQLTHYEAVTGLAQAFPVHYEAWSGGHVAAEKFTDEFIDAYVRCTADELPLPDCALTLAVLEVMGGKLRESRAPVGLNEADLQWVVQAGWADAAAHETGKAYAQRLRSVLGPLSTSMGRYVNLLDVAEDPEMSYEEAATKAAGPANLERLRAVKAKYDPAGVFRNTPFMKVLAVKP
ncbi:hypothetical protein CHLNCDRAFT_133629 [Chlorella variabilis]|uniref:FAD-binding PCMH-type domain-containing protein n=1 Tax=Chlorella variabilis TaxID=554065 RepID=E1Z3H1_CHLVA|nr:hypothetical protein CHLNCDRAFT_133629 [Chlorella variabilis]EFN59850.1 hypothetical protein CHLNCDRAFT_133629 [Chlorella variabilis]|eukprot:XP_005851952.1 hypothetical protein CHLNCDRAFT_133629 [Chlorella variabilis]